MEPGYERSYPFGPRAAHVLGYISLDGERAEGVERFYDRMLRTTGTSMSLSMDALRNRFEVRRRRLPARRGHLADADDRRPHPGGARGRWPRRWRSTARRRRQGIVLDPRTGEVLALAVAPAYDPNAYGEAPLDRAPQPADRVPVRARLGDEAVHRHGPGGDRAVRGTESVYCEQGRWKISKSRTLSDVAKHGTLTLPEVIQLSSNIGIVKFSRRLRRPTCYRTLAGLGFGQRAASTCRWSRRGCCTRRRGGACRTRTRSRSATRSRSRRCSWPPRSARSRTAACGSGRGWRARSADPEAGSPTSGRRPRRSCRVRRRRRSRAGCGG